MRILLAALSIEDDSRSLPDPNCPYSIGVGYLHSVLERDGHTVEMAFLVNFDEPTSEALFFGQVREFAPDIIGFQMFSMNRVATFHAIEQLEKEFPEIRIIIGGVHPSVMYDQILRKYPFVIAAIGEADATVTELVNAIGASSPLEEVRGIAYNAGGSVHVTFPRELIEDLDTLPFPRHEVYFDLEPSRVMGHIVSSRGCPFDCSFCCLKAISHRKYRKRSPENVLAEIRHLKGKYPRLRTIQFHDDTLLLDNHRAIELCKLLVKENLGLEFICSARVKPVSEELFTWMEKAGFSKIMFGLETGSPKLLEAIHKKIKPEDVIQLFELLKHHRFTVTTFLMLGFPGETAETVDETIGLVKRTQRIYYNLIVGIAKLWVYPGTEVYRSMKAAGRIDDGFWLTDQAVPYYTVEHDMDGLTALENRMLDNVSILRILTPRGFVNHFLSMPVRVLAHLAKNRIYVLPILVESLKINAPWLYRALKNIYWKVKMAETNRDPGP